MQILVLGPGCPRCDALYENAVQAVAETGVSAAVERVTDMGQILSYDLLLTPGLVIDGRVRSAGEVPSLAAIKEMLVGEQ
jgi:small redox-active disulfide protein 2